MTQHARSPTSPVGKLETLELGRGLAALFVLLFHDREICTKYLGATPSWALPFVGGHAGVEYFFVLSGFIIYFRHAGDVGDARRLADFIAKRAIRIYPIYWIVISLMLAAFLLNAAWGAEKALGASRVVSDYLLLPHGGSMILPPAWTLQREALFYLIFAVAIVSPVMGTALFFCWQLAVLIGTVVYFLLDLQAAGLWFYFLDIHNLGFAVGVAAAWFVKTRNAPSRRTLIGVAALGIVGVLATMTSEWLAYVRGTDLLVATPRSELIHSALYSLSFGLTVGASAYLERRFRLPALPYISWIGASSYVLYLLHEPLASLFMKLITAKPLHLHPSPNEGYAIEIVGAVAVALAVHAFVERPITMWLRRLYARRSGRLASAKPASVTPLG